MVIDLFIQRYEKEYDFYETAGKLAAVQIEQQLQAMGIRAIVTSRAKSPSSLRVKVANRNENRNSPFASVEEIYEEIIDLAGVRIALYFPSDRMKVDEMIHRQFDVQMKKSFPQDSNPPSYEKRFSGYWANHYRILIKESNVEEGNKRYISAK